VSICLEAHPEIAAVIGRRPLMCTSGATPLEGIPGHSSCGELDPSIAFMLARKLKWGPEQINTVLTQQSGLIGLVGRPVMLDDVLAAEADELEPAKHLLLNHILKACGAGMAAMGGVDDIVFSGRFASAGTTLGPWLRDRLTFHGGNENSPPDWLCFTESLDQVIARKAEIFLLESEKGPMDRMEPWEVRGRYQTDVTKNLVKADVVKNGLYHERPKSALDS
jgi:acetate kinase